MENTNAPTESWIRKISKAYANGLKNKRDSLSSEAFHTVTALDVSTKVKKPFVDGEIERLRKQIDDIHYVREKYGKKGLKFDGIVPNNFFNKFLKEADDLYVFEYMKSNDVDAFDAVGRRNRFTWFASIALNALLFFTYLIIFKPSDPLSIYGPLVVLTAKFTVMLPFTKRPNIIFLSFIYPEFFLLRGLVGWILEMVKKDKGSEYDYDPEVLFRNPLKYPRMKLYMALPIFSEVVQEQIKVMLQQGLEPYLILDKRDIEIIKPRLQCIDLKKTMHYCYLVCAEVYGKTGKNQTTFYTAILTGLENYDQEEKLLHFTEQYANS